MTRRQDKAFRHHAWPAKPAPLGKARAGGLRPSCRRAQPLGVKLRTCRASPRRVGTSTATPRATRLPPAAAAPCWATAHLRARPSAATAPPTPPRAAAPPPHGLSQTTRNWRVVVAGVKSARCAALRAPQTAAHLRRPPARRQDTRRAGRQGATSAAGHANASTQRRHRPISPGRSPRGGALAHTGAGGRRRRKEEAAPDASSAVAAASCSTASHSAPSIVGRRRDGAPGP